MKSTSTLSLLVFLALPFLMAGQHRASMNMSLAKQLQEQPQNEQLISILVKGNVQAVNQYVQRLGGKVNYVAGSVTCVMLPLNKVGELARFSSVLRMESNQGRIRIMNDSVVIHNNVLKAHDGVAPLTQGYDGSGVVIGIIDTGIDFSHPDFKDDNDKSRVKYLWDQNLALAANTPQPYGYGQEWNNLQIDSGQANAHKDQKYYGHGTHVSGIAAGNGRAILKDSLCIDSLINKGYVPADFKGFRGMAPKADLIVVAVNFDDVTHQTITDAANYIFTKAAALGKPCVINVSLGDPIGSHDGKDLQSQVIDGLLNAKTGRSLVAAGGNWRTSTLHTRHELSNDSAFTWYKYNGGDIYLQTWGDTSQMKNMQLAIGVDNIKTYSHRGHTAYASIASQKGVLIKDSIMNNGKRIGKILMYRDIQENTYYQEVLITPDSTTDYRWRLMLKGTGKADSYSWDGVATGMPSPVQFPDIVKYVSPDLSQNISSGFQCSDSVITVANYTNRIKYLDYSGKPVNGSVPGGAIFPSSSVGPTRDKRIKPDIGATGGNVVSAAVLSLVPLYIVNNQGYKIAIGKKHMINSGTSMASPTAAGSVALYLQKNPNASAINIKNDFIHCAKRDNYTGYNLPDSSWGYGKINTFAALTGCITTSTEPVVESGNNSDLQVFPNPFNDKAEIKLQLLNSQDALQAELKIYNVMGALVKSLSPGNSTSVILEREQLESGVYFIQLSVSGQHRVTKKIILL